MGKQRVVLCQVSVCTALASKKQAPQIASRVVPRYYPGDQVASGQFYGALFTTAGVTMFIMAICVYKPMILRIGENPTVAIGGILRALGFMGMSFAPSPGWFAAAAILQISGGNLISPTTSSPLGVLPK